MKDLFTGSLGKLNNHGGSKIYTTPNTILVPPEYEIDVGEHSNFISCSLDGRLWLFEDRIIAIKWNATTGKMEYATFKSFSDETFVAHGRDWILTDKSIIQVVDESPYIFHETHDEDVAPMENFYSLVPPLQGFQIVNGYLIRKPNESYENLMYPISTANIYLTFNEDTIWARTPSGIGRVLIVENEGQYSLDFEYTHSFTDNSWQNMGIAFINDDIFGFKNNQNNKTLCPCSEDTQLYSVKNSSWSTLSGKIYFDPFNRSGIIINDNGINLLASEKSIECKGLSQWIAPTNQIQSIDDNIIISSVNDSVLATYLNSGLYRGLLTQKSLALTTQVYDSLKLSLGLEDNSKININGIIFKDSIQQSINFTLLNFFEKHIETIPYGLYENDNEKIIYEGIKDPEEGIYSLAYPVFITFREDLYTLLDSLIFYYDWAVPEDGGWEGVEGPIKEAGILPAGTRTEDETRDILSEISERTTITTEDGFILYGTAWESVEAIWDSMKRDRPYGYTRYTKTAYNRSYFIIYLDTGTFLEYSLHQNLPYEVETIFPHKYFSKRSGTCELGFCENYDNISLVYGYYYDYDEPTIEIAEVFNDGWRILTDEKIHEFINKNISFALINNVDVTSDTINSIFVIPNQNTIRSNTFYFTNNQKELLKKYNKSNYIILNYYNIHKKDKFAHVLFCYPSGIENSIFFVFHTTIL